MLLKSKKLTMKQLFVLNLLLLKHIPASAFTTSSYQYLELVNQRSYETLVAVQPSKTAVTVTGIQRRDLDIGCFLKSKPSTSSLLQSSRFSEPTVTKTATTGNKKSYQSGTNTITDSSAICRSILSTVALCIAILTSTVTITFTSNVKPVSAATTSTASASTTSSLASTAIKEKQQQSYDGFAEYAKENQMEQSDVSCFMNQCGKETKTLFQNPRGIKGIVCLGQCKGEQACATRCFAQFGSTSLNEWLSCTIEVNECVKVPKSTIDNSAENIGYTTTVKQFDPTTLVGTWYKTNGLNPNYDLFDCQTNTFKLSSSASSSPSPKALRELDMDIFFRVKRPEGGYWENVLTEHMVVDNPIRNNNDNNNNNNDNFDDGNDMNPSGRTMHTSGTMYGLQFSENWYILGESDGKGSIPPFKLVAYKGHTLQGNYEGAFVYAKEPALPVAAIPAVSDAASKAGLNFNNFIPIDNTCPSGIALNDINADTGTSTADWINLVIGEGGVIDWIVPGWRGEYKKSK